MSSNIDANNLREESYRHAIRFYMRSGLKPEALALYNKCQHVLETILGVSPSVETGKLIKSIVEHN
ncbi:MAG: hypothetical protein HQK89_09360 [Nitrospirae bacterium]|nr:hypothetical protein [Nitrospirota bacterium]